MYKIYGIPEAEYPRPDYHLASRAKPLVGGQGRSPLKLKAILYFGRPVELAILWLWGGGTCPLCPRGSANGSGSIEFWSCPKSTLILHVLALFCWGRQKFWDLNYKAEEPSDHVPKFRGDGPTELGDFALKRCHVEKKKKKTPAVKRKTAGKYRSGRPNNNRW